MENTAQANPSMLKEKKQKSYPGKKSRHYDHGWVSAYCHKWNNPSGIRLTISPASYFDNRAHISICICWLTFYFNLPIYSTWDACEYPEYGFYYHHHALVLEYGYEKRKFVWMPWNFEWQRTSKLNVDGTWLTERKGQWKKWKKEHPGYTMNELRAAQEAGKENLWSERHHYKYTTKNCEVQDDIEATISVSQMEWRPRWFQWTKLFSKIRKYIDVQFSEEVGNQRGSWKGGVTGCSYIMLPDETPFDTLMRMQKERSFDR